MRRILFSLLAAGLIAASAEATTVDGCTAFASANGSTSYPGTNVGTVGTGSGQICQIGNISANNLTSSGTFVNTQHPLSIYEFYWGGGALTITEQLGNSGLGDAIVAELDSLAGINSTSSSGVEASIVIPFTSGPSSVYTVYNDNLAAGYYAMGTSLAEGNLQDPTYQINIQSSVPEPSTLFPFLIAFLGLLVWRSQTKLQYRTRS